MNDDGMIPEIDLGGYSNGNDEQSKDEVSETQTANRKPEHDVLLQELVGYCNHWGAGASITLNLGGSNVSGDMISVQDYFKKLAVQYQGHFKGSPEAAKNLADRILSLMPDEADPETPMPEQLPRFIHLENVRTYAPGRPQITVTTEIWRGRISEVKGFSLFQPSYPKQ